VIVLIIIEVIFYGTGFNGYTMLTTSKATSGTASPTITTTTVYQPGKTLWDWMQLLFISVVLTVAGFWFNHGVRKATELRAENELKAAEKRADVEREIALDNQREVALQGYINKMSELILREHLSESISNPQVKSIAQARTATVLRILDPVRRVSVIQFLSQSGILSICVEKSIKGSFDSPLNNENSLASIDLQETNLNGANLSMICLEKANLQNTSLKKTNLYGTDLSGANLQGANLTEADLRRAKLVGTNLQGARLFLANLQGAILSGANLENANLFEAEISQEQLKRAKSLKKAIMPDRSMHP
jgi:hypothetical protein